MDVQTKTDALLDETCTGDLDVFAAGLPIMTEIPDLTGQTFSMVSSAALAAAMDRLLQTDDGIAKFQSA